MGCSSCGGNRTLKENTKVQVTVRGTGETFLADNMAAARRELSLRGVTGTFKWVPDPKAA